jgi:hypothetical protein
MDDLFYTKKYKLIRKFEDILSKELVSLKQEFLFRKYEIPYSKISKHAKVDDVNVIHIFLEKGHIRKRIDEIIEYRILDEVFIGDGYEIILLTNITKYVLYNILQDNINCMEWPKMDTILEDIIEKRYKEILCYRKYTLPILENIDG